MKDDVKIDMKNEAYSITDVADDANASGSAYSFAEESVKKEATDNTMKENILYGTQ